MTREKVSYEEYVTNDKGVQNLLERIEDDGSEDFLDKIIRLAAYESQLWTERWTVRMYMATALILVIAFGAVVVSAISNSSEGSSGPVWLVWLNIVALVAAAVSFPVFVVLVFRYVSGENKTYSDRFN